MTRGIKQIERICSVENCARSVESHGLCSMHARRKRKFGSPHIVLLSKNKGKTCKVENCNNPAFSKEYCQQHYDSVHKHGREHLIIAPRGTGYVNKDGYKEIYVNGEKILEHVYLAEKALGRKLPKGAVVHHQNENKLDNYTPFNLVICPDQKYHMLLHKILKEKVEPIVANTSLDKLDL